MRLKKPLSIAFAALLLMSMAVVATATPWDGVPDVNHAAQAIWVDPDNITCLDMGDEFLIDILVNYSYVSLMYGFQYKTKWNNTVLKLQEIQTHENLPGWTSVFVADNTTWVAGVNLTDADYHNFAASATAGAGFTGVTSLCTYKFKVNWQPTHPAPDFCDIIDLWNDILVAKDLTQFADISFDADYCVHSVVPEKPKVGVDPDYVMGVYGENFTIDIVIEPDWPMFDAWDMCGWEAKLYYNTSVLDALECIEGAWFKGFEGVNGTYPICNINDTAGVVHMADLYLGGHTKPSGSGVLMTIKFNATSMYLVPPGIPPHLYPMDLEDVLLVDCSSEPIPQKYPANDGEYEEPYKILGWALDCWTDPYRKLNEGNSYETPNTGAGISDPGENGEWDIINDYPGTGDWISVDETETIWTADCYEPQEFVKLYAYLSYNEWPEQNKIIMFEIYGPCNPYHNISIIRTALTDSNGVATINFTIPHPCENLEDIVFGKWVCWQSAQVKDPWDPLRYKKVVDVLFWDVGWKVELLAVEATDTAVACGETAITVWYKNIAQVPMWVVFTFTVFDTLLDPLGELVTGMWVDEGVYCHPAYGNFTVYIHIPKWAHVGPCAHVAVNAFTALPMQCGLPYCPEVQDHFTITLPP